jgi:hypothetical protein
VRHCDGRVLRLDVHERRGGSRMHAADVAEEPFEHIDVMAGLIGKDSAVVSPGSTPFVLIVIGLIPTPAHTYGAEDQLAEPAGQQRLARLHDRDVEAVLLHHEQLHAGGIAGLDHRVGIREPQGHGLFDDDVLSRLRDVDDMHCMQPARRHNGNNIHIGSTNEIREAMEPGNRISAGELICSLGDLVTNGSQRCTLAVPATERVGVTLRYAPAAKQANSNHACKIPSQLMDVDLDWTPKPDRCFYYQHLVRERKGTHRFQGPCFSR